MKQVCWPSPFLSGCVFIGVHDSHTCKGVTDNRCVVHMLVKLWLCLFIKCEAMNIMKQIRMFGVLYRPVVLGLNSKSVFLKLGTLPSSAAFPIT